MNAGHRVRWAQGMLDPGCARHRVHWAQGAHRRSDSLSTLVVARKIGKKYALKLNTFYIWPDTNQNVQSLRHTVTVTGRANVQSLEAGIDLYA